MKVFHSNFFTNSMASFAARSASQTIRASRRASSLAAKTSLKPAQTASYSLLARAAVAKVAQPPIVRGHLIPETAQIDSQPYRASVASRLLILLVLRKPSTSVVIGLWLSYRTISKMTPLRSLAMDRKATDKV